MISFRIRSVTTCTDVNIPYIRLANEILLFIPLLSFALMMRMTIMCITTASTIDSFISSDGRTSLWCGGRDIFCVATKLSSKMSRLSHWLRTRRHQLPHLWNMTAIEFEWLWVCTMMRWAFLIFCSQFHKIHLFTPSSLRDLEWRFLFSKFFLFYFGSKWCNKFQVQCLCTRNNAPTPMVKFNVSRAWNAIGRPDTFY